MTPRQLTLPLDPAGKFTAEDFLVTPANEAAFNAVTGWPWPSRGLLLSGPEGSGKSHLAAIWAEQADGHIYEAGSLSEDFIAGIEEGTSLAVENITAPEVSENLLFHLLNVSRERGVWLLFTARQTPNLLWPKLPDLASRLRQMIHAGLETPDDGLVRAVLVKLFDDRQLAVDADVIDYVARRMERSLGAARALVAALDEESLALGRRVSKPVAATVLTRLGAEEDEA